MNLKFPFIALLIVALVGTLVSTMIFDETAITTYNPNTTQFSEDTRYGDWFGEMNKTHSLVQNTTNNIEENVKGEDEFDLEDLGSGIGASLKLIGSLLNLALLNNLILMTASILGISSTVASIILSMIFVAIIFTIIGVIIRWRT